ncbi:MAG: hypothetical protein AAF221_14935 [Pseudomonadota bacterium]
MSDGHEEGLRKQGSARCGAMSYSDMLDNDTRDVPDFLRDESYEYRGSAPIAAERYTSDAFFTKEKDKLWPKIWQFAARDEEVQLGNYQEIRIRQFHQTLDKYLGAQNG